MLQSTDGRPIHVGGVNATKYRPAYRHTERGNGSAKNQIMPRSREEPNSGVAGHPVGMEGRAPKRQVRCIELQYKQLAICDSSVDRQARAITPPTTPR